MILTFPRKFQAGGTLTAQTEYVPINLNWEDTGKDLKNAAPLKVAEEPVGIYDKYNNYKLEGLESDKQSLYNEIETIKKRMIGGINANYTKEAYETDANNLHRLLTVDLADQSQKESRFKEVQTAASNAKSDMAINNGQAFVYDVIGRKYDIVPIDKMLTQRAVGKDGKKVSRYIPQTVGTALEARESNPYFTGRAGGKGQALEQILHSIQSTKDLSTQLKSAFSGVGITGNADTNVESIGGAPIGELYNFLADKMGAKIDPTTGRSLLATTSTATKTNMSQLNSAYQLLRSTAEASGLGEVLKRNAYIAYMNEYGDKDQAPDYQTFVKKKVDEQLTNAMMSYLRENHAESVNLKETKGAGGKSGSGTSGAGDKYELNSLTEAIDSPGENVQIDPLADVPIEGIKGKRSVNVNTTAVKDQNLFNYEGFKFAEANKLPKTLIRNFVVGDISASDNLEDNMFLPNVQNTPLKDLANGQGLSKAVLAPGKSPVIYHSLPVTKDRKTGKYGVAWTLLMDGAPGELSTHDKAVARAAQKTGTTSGAAFDEALAEEYKRIATMDDRVANLGNIQVRKVIKYDLLVPTDPKTLLGWFKKETDAYKALVTEPNKASDADIAYWEEMTKSGAKGDTMKKGGTIFNIPVFSVLAPNMTIRTKAAQWLPSNKIEMGAARMYAGEKQAQERNLLTE